MPGVVSCILRRTQTKLAAELAYELGERLVVLFWNNVGNSIIGIDWPWCFSTKKKDFLLQELIIANKRKRKIELILASVEGRRQRGDNYITSY